MLTSAGAFRAATASWSSVFMRRADLLARLAGLKPWLAGRGVSRVRLFGSHARDEAGPDSDVDLIVELSWPMAPATPWPRSVGLRNRLAHGYDLEPRAA
jgi:predicted nucleotidyltransferase